MQYFEQRIFEIEDGAFFKDEQQMKLFARGCRSDSWSVGMEEKGNKQKRATPRYKLQKLKGKTIPPEREIRMSNPMEKKSKTGKQAK